MTNSTMNTIRLISNIETVKAEKMDAKSKEISIVVKAEDLEVGKDNPVFYPSRWGMEYDTSDFRPINGGGNKLPDDHVEQYFKMLDAARTEYKRMLEKRGNGGGGGGSAGTEILEKKLEIKEARINEQTRIITDLSEKLEKAKKAGNGGSAEKEKIDQLEKMIATLSKVYGPRIEIQIKDTTRTIEGIAHERFATILQMIVLKRHVYMFGPAGTGKSDIAEKIAKAAGLKFYPASTITQEFKLTGFQDMKGDYHETNFYKACKHGGLFFLDEMDACVPDVLVGINGVLANKYFDFPGETVKLHPDFRCIAAGNTIGHGGNEIYTGRYVIDRSTMDRFEVIRIDYSPAIDEAIADGDQELLEFANSLRKASAETNIVILMSYRSLSSIIELKEYFPLHEVMEYSIIKGMAADDMTMLLRNMTVPNSNQYFKAFKQAVIAA